MPTRQQVAAQSISPVLFLTVDGEPMSFFLRPGPTKRQLQPKIKAGGGLMCNSQQPGAILLMDPKDRSSVSESDAHLYVSTQYILDCIEKEEQLSVEDYRFNPVDVPKQDRTKAACPRLSGGRLAYTSDDDTAILEYVSTRKAEIGGNRLWREMEQQRVTHHSWQSMKCRYKDRLAKKQPEVVKVESTEKQEGNKAEEDDTKDEDDLVLEVEIPAEAAVASPQKQSKESEKVCGTNADPHKSTSSEESGSDSQRTDGPAEQSAPSQAMTVPASRCSTTEDPTAELPADAPPRSPDIDGPQPVDIPQNQSLLQDSPPLQPESPPKAATPGKLKDKQEASPTLDRPMTRRKLELEVAAASPEHYGKKLRSSTSSAASSPQPSKKTTPVKAALQRSTEKDQPLPKRARRNIAAAAAGETSAEQSEAKAERKTTPADQSKLALQKDKKKPKRQLGILELATREFESECDEEDDLTVEDSAETVATSAELLPPPTETAADPRPTQPSPKTASSPNGNVPESSASSSNCVPDTSPSDPAAAKPAASEPAGVTSKAHLFIFDSESQGGDSERVAGDASAAPSLPHHSASKDASLSFTQVQLEEDKQRIKELMVQTQQDLVSVTKALLKTSGNFSAALDLLLNPSSLSVSIWSRRDDSLLLSADPVIRQQLQEKHGEEGVAKRMVFLEVEG
uniref:Telomeric repeat-binding factor 2-interacting protein 1 n=1 Tax=Oryzias sinensis TaxID=183150 RepID=A0A8C8DK16_9TELE